MTTPTTTIKPARMSERRVRTGITRWCYEHINSPRTDQDPGARPKYSLCVLIPKEDTATLDLIKQAMKAAADMGRAKLGKAKPKLPLRDGDEKADDNPEFAGHYFINANTYNKPSALKLVNGQAVAADPQDIYSGCYGSVTLEFYAYANSGNKGIAAGLGNVLKTDDGESLAGSVSAENDFGDIVEFASSEFNDTNTGIDDLF